MKHKWVLSSALAVMTAVLLAAPTTAVAQPRFVSRILQASGINEVGIRTRFDAAGIDKATQDVREN